MIENRAASEPDVILVGAGIMSATLGIFLKELEPALNILMVESLDGAALESSDAWNNAGTGHAATRVAAVLVLHVDAPAPARLAADMGDAMRVVPAGQYRTAAGGCSRQFRSHQISHRPGSADGASPLRRSAGILSARQAR